MSTEKIIKPTKEAYKEWERLNRNSMFGFAEDEDESFYRRPKWILDHRNKTAIDLRNLPCE